MKKLSILFFGNTNNYPLLLAEGMRALGHEVRLIVNRKELLHRPESKHPEWRTGYPEWILDYAHVTDEDLALRTDALLPLIQEIQKPYDLAVLNDWGPSLAIDLKAPHVSFLTGSDLLVNADYSLIDKRFALWDPLFRKSEPGRKMTAGMAGLVTLQRDGILTSRAVSFAGRGLCPDGDRLLDAIGVSDEQRRMFCLSDLHLLKPAAFERKLRLRILCGSRLVLDVKSDPALTAMDVKGTEVLLNGFASYVRQGGSAELYLPLKGQDVERAREYVRKLQISEHVVWFDEMPLCRFHELMASSDIICDQFGTSFPGMLTMDAFALGRAVMADLRPDFFGRHFGENLPGLHARTAEDVSRHLAAAEKNPEILSVLGADSRRFAEKYLDPQKTADALLQRVTADDQHHEEKTIRRAWAAAGDAFLASESGSGKREKILYADLQDLPEDALLLINNPRLVRLFIRFLKFLDRFYFLRKLRSGLHHLRRHGFLSFSHKVREAAENFIFRMNLRLAAGVRFDAPWNSRWPSIAELPAPRMVPAAKLKTGPSICLVTVNLSAGGAERQVAGLAIEFKKRGYDVRVRVLRQHKENGHYLPFLKRFGIDAAVPPFPGLSAIRDLQKAGVDLSLLKHVPVDLRGITLALTADLIRNPVDVVHCYLDWSCCYGGLAALLARVPCVRLSGRNVNPSHFEFHRAWMRPLYRFFSTLPNFHFENNTRLGALDYAGWIGIDEKNIDVVANGLAPVFFEPETIRPKEEIRRRLAETLKVQLSGPVVVSIGRLSGEKRPLDVWEVYKRVRYEIPDAAFLYIGTGPMEALLREKVRSEGADKSKPGGFFLLGLRSDVFEILQAADAFLLTSSHEGMPNALMEAMYAGLPVVASKAGGVNDLVEDGVQGFLHETGNISGMAESLTLLLKSAPSFRARFGEESRRRILEGFTVEHLADKLISVYREHCSNLQEVTSDAGR